MDKNINTGDTCIVYWGSSTVAIATVTHEEVKKLMTMSYKHINSTLSNCVIFIVCCYTVSWHSMLSSPVCWFSSVDHAICYTVVGGYIINMPSSRQRNLLILGPERNRTEF